MAAAIFAAIYARRAAVATEQTVELARSAAADAVEAINIAGLNAEAAMRLADITERTNKAQYRPYVWITSATLKDSDEGLFVIELELRNSSFQPAIVQRLQCELVWVLVGEFVDKFNTIDLNINWVAPTNTSTMIPITVEGRPGRGNDQGQLCVIAKIVYRDFSGSTYDAPGSFESPLLEEFEAIDEYTEMTPMIVQMVAGDNAEKPDEETDQSAHS